MIDASTKRWQIATISDEFSASVFSQLDSLRPRASHPFYIVSPPFNRISAGVTVLHLLCHYLNLLGENAFIVHYPPESRPRRNLPSYATVQRMGEIPAGLLAPIISHDIIEHYHQARLTPITIYPEVYDDPLNAPLFARFVLNYPGLLAPHYKKKADFYFAYTQILAEYCGINETLFMPTVDLSFFYNKLDTVRTGACFYAGKYQDILRKKPVDVPAGSVEILRSTIMTREEFREIFWRSEFFYCYEDTSLALEAGLCGCPTIFVPNERFSGTPLAAKELGFDGTCKFGDREGMKDAKRTVDNIEKNVRKAFSLVPNRITHLANRLKVLANEREYRGTISYPFETRMVFFEWPPATKIDPNEDINVQVERDRLVGAFQDIRCEIEAIKSTNAWRLIRLFKPIRRGMRRISRSLNPTSPDDQGSA